MSFFHAAVLNNYDTRSKKGYSVWFRSIFEFNWLLQKTRSVSKRRTWRFMIFYLLKVKFYSECNCLSFASGLFNNQDRQNVDFVVIWCRVKNFILRSLSKTYLKSFKGSGSPHPVHNRMQLSTCHNWLTSQFRRTQRFLG